MQDYLAFCLKLSKTLHILLVSSRLCNSKKNQSIRKFRADFWDLLGGGMPLCHRAVLGYILSVFAFT